MACLPPQLINLLACSCQVHLPKLAAHVWCCYIPLCCSCLGLSLSLSRSALLLCLLRQHRLLLFPVRQTPMNFVVLPAASCLDYSVVHCGKEISLLFSKLVCRMMSLATVKPCLAVCVLFLNFILTLWEFPLLLWYPEVFRGLVLADWSIYAPCVSSFSPLWLVKI